MVFPKYSFGTVATTTLFSGEGLRLGECCSSSITMPGDSWEYPHSDRLQMYNWRENDRHTLKKMVIVKEVVQMC